nr:NAD(P)/FAD-dependent oxidoreductase [Neobacillus jeddahensis]
MKVYDVTIIGGGPVGLFTAFYCGMREMETKVIEFLPFVGGKVSYFYPEKVIRDIGGIPAIAGEDLIRQLEAQAKTFHPTIVLNQQVLGVEKVEDGTFVLTSHTGERHYTRTVILATGFGALKSAKLELENACHYEQKSIFYDAIDTSLNWTDKHVMLVGGGNSTVDWAIKLLPLAKQVTVVHRKNEFAGIGRNITYLKESDATIWTPSVLDGLHGDDVLTSVTVKNLESGERQKIEVDAVLVNHGFSIDGGHMKEWQLEFVGSNISVDSGMATNIPGVFAVGDIVTYPNKLHLISGGFAEGPTAANSAKAYLQPGKKLKPLYSTTYEKLQK